MTTMPFPLQTRLPLWQEKRLRSLIVTPVSGSPASDHVWVHRACLVFMSLTLAFLPVVARAQPPVLRVFVASDGNDAWDGLAAVRNATAGRGPLATLEQARNLIRGRNRANALPAGGAVVEIAPGAYELSAPFTLNAEDAGKPGAPVIYRGAGDHAVRLIGGRALRAWSPLGRDDAPTAIEVAARPHIVVTNLRQAGVTDMPSPAPGASWSNSSPGLELFFGGRPMSLARWPNNGYAHIAQVHGKTPIASHGRKGCKEAVFSYDGDRPGRWKDAPEALLHGFWFWDWADQRMRIGRIDTQAKMIELVNEPAHPFGFRAGQWFYAANLLSELDSPGEWYLDRATSVLYFWPPSPIEKGAAMVSTLDNVIMTNDTSFVTFENLVIECCRSDAVAIKNGRSIQVKDCLLRNAGGSAALISGVDCGLDGCGVHDVGNGGVVLSGGDRRTLTPGSLYVTNCDLHDYARWNPICKPGIDIKGVGNRVANNHIHDAPHMAVQWAGNDHRIEFNEIHDVVRIANDAGALYGGFDPTMRGNIIRCNYFHDLRGLDDKGCMGVYLDDMLCGTVIVGNIFRNVRNAVFIGGGQHNRVVNNFFIDCDPAIHLDARATHWAAKSVPVLLEKLEAVPYRDEPWASRFPQLLTYAADNPAAPRANEVVRNLCWGGTWKDVERVALGGVVFEANLVGTDPGFVNPQAADYRFRPGSPARELGIQEIPFDRIGPRPRR